MAAQTRVDVSPVRGRRQLKAFIHLPHRFYAGHPCWVAPLHTRMQQLLSPAKNPFFAHARAEYFVAYAEGVAAGRIAAIENRAHNDCHGDRVGFFGFFESVNDPDVAAALFRAAAQWLRERGLTVLRGPASFSTNDECGLLIEGFEYAPMVMTTYNPPYYEQLLQSFGFRKTKDLLAYYISRDSLPPAFEELLARAASLRARSKVHVRPVNLKRFDEEVLALQDIYNAAWEKNWGFVPLSGAEFHQLARDLRPVIDPQVALIAEVKGEPAACCLAVPDINRALKLLSGRLLPFGWLKLLHAARRTDVLRVIALGIKPRFRKLGIDALLAYEMYERGKARYRVGEMSWILEDNLLMNRILENIGARRYKRYRLYDYALDASS